MVIRTTGLRCERSVKSVSEKGVSGGLLRRNSELRHIVQQARVVGNHHPFAETGKKASRTKSHTIKIPHILSDAPHLKSRYQLTMSSPTPPKPPAWRKADPQQRTKWTLAAALTMLCGAG